VKQLIISALVMMSLGVYAQESGEKKAMGSHSFEYKSGIWFQEGLPETFQTEQGYACYHGDETWQAWYRSGSETIRAILDLGPNVVFQQISSEDGKPHVFVVSQDKNIAAMIAQSSGQGATGGFWTNGKVAAVGSGIIAGAVLVTENNGDDEGSLSKR
jgi:hypothetical protein